MVNSKKVLSKKSSVHNVINEFKDMNNTKPAYILFNDEPFLFADIKRIALRANHVNDELRNFKSNMPVFFEEDPKQKVLAFINSGAPVILLNDEKYDYFDALRDIIELNLDFLKDNLTLLQKPEIYALNKDDKIGVARNYLNKYRSDLLPVLDRREIIGEIRPHDMLFSLLDEMNHKRRMNFKVIDYMDTDPTLIENNASIIDVIKLMIKKHVNSVIVHDNNEIFTVINVKDIFSHTKRIMLEPEYQLELVKNSDIDDEALYKIRTYAENHIKKMAKRSEYNHLKITLKSIGHTENDNQIKIDVKISLLSDKKGTLNIQKTSMMSNLVVVVNDCIKKLEDKIANK